MPSILMDNIKYQKVHTSENLAASVTEEKEAASDATATGAADSANSSTPKKATVVRVVKKKKWKKPKDKPKRPLSAYNLFFRHEREQLIYGADGRKRENNKIGFAALAKNIAAKWKVIKDHSRRIYEVQAEFEQLRYKAEVEEWKSKQPVGSGATPFKKSETDWAKRRDDFAEAMAASTSSNDKPSTIEMLNQHHGHNALINQLMLSQHMGNYANGNDSNNNNNNSGMNNQFNLMGQQYPQYANPLMVNSEMKSQPGYFTSGESELDYLRAYGGGSLQPRRMSEPTTSEQQQYFQMQHNQQQRQQEVEQMAARMAVADLPFGRSLSMPMGIIDNTHNNSSNNNNLMMGDSGKPSMDLYAGFHPGYHPPQQQQQHNVQQQQQAAVTTMEDLIIQAHSAAMEMGNGSSNSSMLNNNSNATSTTDEAMNPSYAAHDGAATSNRRMSMPSGFGSTNVDGANNNNVAPASGRRMSMPLSMEQQMLGHADFNNPQQQQCGQHTQRQQHAFHPQQRRSMHMPMGVQYTMEQRHKVLSAGGDGSEQQQQQLLRGYIHDTRGLDELADILKDDGDLFDW